MDNTPCDGQWAAHCPSRSRPLPALNSEVSKPWGNRCQGSVWVRLSVPETRAEAGPTQGRSARREGAACAAGGETDAGHAPAQLISPETAGGRGHTCDPPHRGRLGGKRERAEGPADARAGGAGAESGSPAPEDSPAPRCGARGLRSLGRRAPGLPWGRARRRHCFQNVHVVTSNAELRRYTNADSQFKLFKARVLNNMRGPANLFLFYSPHSNGLRKLC